MHAKGRYWLSAAMCFLLLTGISTTAQIRFTHQSLPTGDANSFATADIDGNGFPDLIMTVGNENMWKVARQTGPNVWEMGVQYLTVTEPQQLVVADFNQDGKSDVAVIGAPDQEVAFYSGNGNGTFNPWFVFFVGRYLRGIVTADFDGDHVPDFAVSGCRNANGTSCEIRPYINHGEGNFGLAQSLTTISLPEMRNLDVADFNRDGKMDLAVLTVDGLFTFRGSGDGRFSNWAFVNRPEGVSFAIGWFDSDSYADLVIRVVDACQAACQFLNHEYIYLNNKSGGFLLRSSVQMGKHGGGPVRAADINGDHKEDILALTTNAQDRTLRYASGRGDGTFNSPVVAASYNVPLALAVRDFTLDSRQDIAVSDQMAGLTRIGRNTNATYNCTNTPGTRLWPRICGPLNNQTYSSPVLVRASGNGPTSVARLELWVDGVKKGEAHRDQLRKSVSLARGSHRITVVAVDPFGNTAKQSRFINVR